MKTILSIAITAALFFGTAHAAERVTLLAAAPGDLVATQLVAEKSALSADIERAPVDFAWALDPSEPLAASAPFVAKSREFWSNVDAAQMKTGHVLQTTAPGALVRISPAGSEKSQALRSSDLQLRMGGRTLDASAMRVSADAEQLKSTGAQFSDGTLVFRLADEVGAGALEISAKNARGSYLVHVFEPDSAFALTLGADRDRALAGETITLSAQFDGAKGVLAPERIGGLVTAPDGRSIEVTFAPDTPGKHVAQVALPADAGNGLALWEVHPFAVARDGGALVPRDAKTSFAVSRPTARLAGDGAVDLAKRGGVTVSLPVEAASAGRFELRGVLYGSAKDGSMHPFAIAHAARWLEPGQSDIALKFGADVMRTGLGAPYEVRDLSLNDQARLGLLETRARALRIEPATR